MPHGVPKVQVLPNSPIFRIAGDKPRLLPCRGADQVRDGGVNRAVPREAAQAREKRGAADDADFHDLGQPRTERPRRKRPQCLGIAEDAAGVMKGAKEILSQREIDAHLSADSCVGLREKCRREDDPIEPASVGRGGEAGDVRDHASAER